MCCTLEMWDLALNLACHRAVDQSVVSGDCVDLIHYLIVDQSIIEQLGKLDTVVSPCVKNVRNND